MNGVRGHDSLTRACGSVNRPTTLNGGPRSLEGILERLRKASNGESRVALRTIVEAVGRRSFAPLLLVAGLIAFSPVSGIPGVPTLMGLMVLIIATQLLMGRKHFWLPGWLLDRSVSEQKLHKALNFLRKPARFVDRFLRRRWTLLTQGGGFYFIAVLCLLIALTMPPMELVPFAATSAGAALTALALSMMAEDGVLAAVAIVIVLGAGALAVKGLMQ